MWRFELVAPEHPDGYVGFNFALTPRVSKQVRENDPEVWAILLEQLEAIKTREISNAQ